MCKPWPSNSIPFLGYIYLKGNKEWHSFLKALFLSKQFKHPASGGQRGFHSRMLFSESIHLTNAFFCFQLMLLFWATWNHKKMYLREKQIHHTPSTPVASIACMQWAKGGAHCLRQSPKRCKSDRWIPYTSWTYPFLIILNVSVGIVDLNWFSSQAQVQNLRVKEVIRTTQSKIKKSSLWQKKCFRERMPFFWITPKKEGCSRVKVKSLNFIKDIRTHLASRKPSPQFQSGFFWWTN